MSLTEHEGRAEEIDASNKEQLKKQKEGKGEWTSKLASDSESIVKADRGEIKATEDNIRKLQEETEKIASKSK
ncbi:MAG: hypothetical protein M1819_001427 [Sarea resinae]|nr:MAG: hypothetical protein M1819_001427 [Sarea resinae]